MRQPYSSPPCSVHPTFSNTATNVYHSVLELVHLLWESCSNAVFLWPHFDVDLEVIVDLAVSLTPQRDPRYPHLTR